MEPEGAAVLARDLAHLDEGQYDIVAEWMIEHGWTEPLDPVDAPVIPREVLLREIEDARNAGIRPAGGDELLAWNYLLDHFDQFVKGWPFRTSVPYPPFGMSSRCVCGHMRHTGRRCGYPMPTPGNRPPVPRYCDCEG